MRRTLTIGTALLFTAAAALAAHADDRGDGGPGHRGWDRGKEPFSFAAWGDMPYADVELEQIPRLIADVNRSHVAFTVFDGDIKSGSSLCTDDAYSAAAARFDTFEAPMIYVPGDNEWTDCHRTNNGGYNALERLALIRTTLFATPYSFGQHPMRLEHQGAPGAPYAENTRWRFGGVWFAGLNVPGSNNNKVDTDDDCFHKSERSLADCAADNAEYAERDARNEAWLAETFAKARADRALGVVIVTQADPSFDLPETEDFDERTQPGYDGYDNLIAALTAETRGFDGQVLLIHGDTHFFKHDKPLLDQADLLPNFTRLETFGSPNVHWVKVTVDPKARSLFVIEPMIVAGN